MLARFSQHVEQSREFDFCRSVFVLETFFGSIHIMNEGFNEIGSTGGSSGYGSACRDGVSFAGGNFLFGRKNAVGTEIRKKTRCRLGGNFLSRCNRNVSLLLLVIVFECLWMIKAMRLLDYR